MVRSQESLEKKEMDSKALRPITLLNGLNKILKIIILENIFDESPERTFFSANQYDFRRRRSTVDAIRDLTNTIYSPGKHCISIFVEIAGIFDNLWWPRLLQDLHDRRISTGIVGTIRSYLTDRKITYETLHVSTPGGFFTSNSLCHLQQVITK